MSAAAQVVMYATQYCPYCIRARRLLESKQVRWQELDVSAQPSLRQEMSRKAGGRNTVPQIWINGQHVGGCTELYALEQVGELDTMLAAGAAATGRNQT